MAWRAPYKALCEMFPQVDVRIIRGTVLDHGSDLASAVEFIMNEVLTPEELESASSQLSLQVSLVQNFEGKPTESGIMYAAQPQQQQGESRLSLATHEHTVPEGGDAAILLATTSTELFSVENSSTEKRLFDPCSSEELLRRWICEEADLNGQPTADNASVNVRSSFLGSPHQSTAMLSSLHETPQLRGQASEGNDGETESDNETAKALACGREKFSFAEQLSKLKALMEVDSLDNCSISSGASSEGDQSTEDDARGWSSYKGYPPQQLNDMADTSDEHDHQSSAAQLSTSGHFQVATPVSCGADEVLTKLSELSTISSSCGKMNVVSENITDSHVWRGMASWSLDASELSKEENYSSVYSDLQDATTAEEAMCESLNFSSSQSASIDNLDQAFQQARNGKDDLIAAIEGISLLQQELEQADVAARQAKADAALGGIGILAKAQELRELVGQRRQANEIHAGEVYGERAVLATEARELRSRLSQVMEEKTKAFNHILQIKALLQSQVDIAIKERERAEAEKLEKENKAMEVLSFEQALFDKVEHESKELEVEAEACTKLRDFLIDRGSSVDSIQGEVAILCEDVEALMVQVQGTVASGSRRLIQASSQSRSSKSSWNSLGLELSDIGSSKLVRSSLEPNAPGVAVGGSHTVEFRGKDNKMRNFSGTALPEHCDSSLSVPFYAASASGSSTGSVSNSSKVVCSGYGAWPLPSDLGAAGWLSPMGYEASSTSKHVQLETSAGESRDASFPVGVETHDTGTEERLAYEARMAILPAASEFGVSNERYDLFRVTKPNHADDDGWQLLN